MLNHIAKTGILCTAFLLSSSASLQATWNTLPDWNLPGNYRENVSLNIASSDLADPLEANSVWLFNGMPSAWQFYTPSPSMQERLIPALGEAFMQATNDPTVVETLQV